jgi:hypothetical protein
MLPAVRLPRIPPAYLVVAAGWALPTVLAVVSGSVVVWAALAVGGAVVTTAIVYAEPRLRSLEYDSFDRGLRAGIHGLVELRDGETF